MCAELVYVVAAAAGTQQDKDHGNWEYVHRILAHASAGYCERTVKLATGLPQCLEKPTRPCPECALSKMKAQRRGNGELSTGLPAASKPGKKFNSDIFGPVTVPGVNSERYFITLLCTKSGWGTVCCMVSKNQAPKMVEEMINKARFVGKLVGDADVIIQAGMFDFITLHQSKVRHLR
jgi:hypothetical protein